MDNELSNNIKQVTESSKAVNPQTQVTTSTPAGPAKSNKALIVILSIFLVLSLGAAAAFAYLYFSNNTQNTPTSTPTPETPVSDETEEVEITDTYVLRDLDEKMAVLHFSSITSPVIVKERGMHPELQLYENSDLSEVAKAMHLIYSLSNQARYLSYDEKLSIASELGYSGSEKQALLNEPLEGIDANIVAQKYLDVFGKELVYSQIMNDKYCPVYSYSVANNVYYLDPRGGCGGTSPYDNYYYKYKYTVQGNNTYVYVAATTVSPDTSENAQVNSDDIVYCDVVKYYADSNNKPEVCTTIAEADAFTINDSNYQDFAQYRFVFHKADNGTYYFEKVEQL